MLRLSILLLGLKLLDTLVAVPLISFKSLVFLMFLRVSVYWVLDRLGLSLELRQMLVECELKVLVPHQIQLKVIFSLILAVERGVVV